MAYAVYLAERLARAAAFAGSSTGRGVALRQVLAVRDGGPAQFTLSWVLGCIEDPQGDNVGFKFAGALKDFGEDVRGRDMFEQLEAYEGR